MPTSGVVDESTELVDLVANSRLTGYLAVLQSDNIQIGLRYDHIHCFPEEVELMWKSRFGLAKMIYVSAQQGRSKARISQTSHSCGTDTSARLLSVIGVSGLAHLGFEVDLREIKTDSLYKVVEVSAVIIGSVDFVLMFRPRILVWIFAFMELSVSLEDIGYICGTADNSGKACRGILFLLRGDEFNGSGLLTLAVAVPVLVTFLMFVMTVHKCCTTLRADLRHVMPIWRVFLRDGVVWVVVVFAVTGTELLVWAMRRESFKQLLVAYALPP
ncbi:hypothetical protein B0H15DRAFT_804506 [Mycena belliarum]|uniref:DUF6533 domain-containing protein n=1 Tax=Mycena belliarum TaxID=1033014 RepID=A0AAD6XPR5_9AGAR|nr:hypothetical protein B0H15DRAFT_804499 [Mycena belliae]KAJ7079236.1 hypothetical protein B0H15DRAFT_804506 [Mycena belliae]